MEEKLNYDEQMKSVPEPGGTGSADFTAAELRRAAGPAGLLATRARRFKDQRPRVC
jgi:hypothetical protein